MTKSSDQSASITYENLSVLYILSRFNDKGPFLVEKGSSKKGDVDRIIKFENDTVFRIQIKSNINLDKLTCNKAKEGFNQLYFEYMSLPPENREISRWLLAWEGSLESKKVKPLSIDNPYKRTSEKLDFLHEMGLNHDNRDLIDFIDKFDVISLPSRIDLQHSLETMIGKDSVANACYILETKGLLNVGQEGWPEFNHTSEKPVSSETIFHVQELFNLIVKIIEKLFSGKGTINPAPEHFDPFNDVMYFLGMRRSRGVGDYYFLNDRFRLTVNLPWNRSDEMQKCLPPLRDELIQEWKTGKKWSRFFEKHERLAFYNLLVDEAKRMKIKVVLNEDLCANIPGNAIKFGEKLKQLDQYLYAQYMFQKLITLANRHSSRADFQKFFQDKYISTRNPVFSLRDELQGKEGTPAYNRNFSIDVLSLFNFPKYHSIEEEMANATHWEPFSPFDNHIRYAASKLGIDSNAVPSWVAPRDEKFSEILGDYNHIDEKSYKDFIQNVHQLLEFDKIEFLKSLEFL